MRIKKWKEMLESMWQRDGKSFIQFLLDAGLDVNSLNKFGKTILSYAVEVGNFKLANYLVQKGGDANVENSDGSKPLHIAAKHGRKDIVNFLLNKGISADSLSNANWTALHYVSAKRSFLPTDNESNEEIVRILVNRGADVNAVNSNGCTPLLVAAQNLNSHMVELFIKLGANLECCDEDQWTVLHHACKKILPGIVQTLVEGRFDIDLNARTSRGYTPLIIAAESKRKVFVKLLIESGVNVKWRTCDGKTVLHHACEAGWLDVVKCLLSKGCDLNAKDSQGNTPLLKAASKSHFTVVKHLIECGAEVVGCDTYGRRVMHWSCEIGCLRLDMVKFLLREGYDLNAKDSRGITPLLIAAGWAPSNIVKYLMECRADEEGRDKRGWTVLHWTCWDGWLELVKSLTKKGCDVNIPNSFRNTPLHLAVYQFHKKASYLEIIKHLFNLGADSNVENIKYETAFILCIQLSLSLEVIRLFLENGAYFGKIGYTIISNNDLHKKRIFQNTEICTWALINKFNMVDLRKIKKIPVVSTRLPPIEKLKITSQREEVQNIEDCVKYEIQTNGYCNVLNVRPIVLKMLCVTTLLKHYN